LHNRSEFRVERLRTAGAGSSLIRQEYAAVGRKTNGPRSGRLATDRGQACTEKQPLRLLQRQTSHQLQVVQDDPGRLLSRGTNLKDRQGVAPGTVAPHHVIENDAAIAVMSVELCLPLLPAHSRCHVQDLAQRFVQQVSQQRGLLVQLLQLAPLSGGK
jgi:hypothetical protein